MHSYSKNANSKFVFANENDFEKIIILWKKAFGDDEDYIRNYLKNYFNRRRILLYKIGEDLCSMLSIFSIEIDNKKTNYIYALATDEKYKGRGIATDMLQFVQQIFECDLILQPEQNGVEIFYKKIGFQNLSAEKLWSVCEEYNITDLTLGKFDGFIREYKEYKNIEFNFEKITENNIENVAKYFSLSPNKSCESNPLCLYIYHNLFSPEFFIFNEICFVIYRHNGKIIGAALPYCSEYKMPFAFKILEKYFENILNITLKIFAAHFEGVEYLKNCGVLDNYIVEENETMRDYLYDGNSMRTLKGKKLSKKRNLIHQFEKNFENRWEYASLTENDKEDIKAFIEKWYKDYHINDNENLNAEYEGIIDVINADEMYRIFKFGGIKIDGVLRAISIGSFNKSENMAIIDVEKADHKINGLYQIINRDFLLHEFPTAKIINREDDVGEENLRRAKMSYYPIGYAKKFNIIKQS